MSLQTKIWITFGSIIIWLVATCLYKADFFSKVDLNSFEDKQQNYWTTNKGQDINPCSMKTEGLNRTDDYCTQYDIPKEYYVTQPTINEEKSDTIKDDDKYRNSLTNEDQLEITPRARRKWKKPFRIVSGWARNPTPPNPCNSGPCQNGGVCTRTGTYSYSCNCAGTGYEGTTCGSEIDECLSNPCQYGTCSNYVKHYTCNCIPGYIGTNCNINFNECGSSPCQHGGICVDGVNKYTCNCVPGYTGTHCETDIDECASIPCQNQQTCIDHVNGYTCDCSDRYNGTYCEKDCRPGPADILFLIDSSSSGRNTLNASIDFIEQFLDMLPIGPDDFLMAAISFSNNATLEFGFNDYHDNTSLRNAFRSITNKGLATYTDIALSLARDVIFNASLGARSNAYKYVILLYDGMSTERTAAISMRSTLLPSSIARVYTVGIGEQVDHFELQQIASESEYVFSSVNNDAINRLLQETSHKDCYDCKETTKTDILILVDASSSNTITELQHFLSTAGDLVRHFDVDNSPDVHMTIAGFADLIHNNFPFGALTSNNALLSAVQKIIPQSSCANAEEALRHAREVTFLPTNGGRIDARKLVALISNGKWVSHNSVVTEAEKLKLSGITLFNIGVGIETDIDKFFDIATDAFHVFLVLDGNTSHLSSISIEAKYSTCPTDIFSKRI